MQINPISNFYNPDFRGVSRLRLKNGSTAVFKVSVNENPDITKISCKVWNKGKLLKQLGYKWKDGISFMDIDSIENKISKEIGAFSDETREHIAKAYINDILFKNKI